jgi:AcrR family transcriptional regulator
MADVDAISPLKAARRDKILSAAQRLFSEQGLRATTMEAIAERSGVAKATVYAYFRDKDQVFTGVAARVADQVQASVVAALDQPGPLAERIGAALNAKHDLIFTIVRSSAFAGELFAAQNQIAAESFSALDSWIQNRIAGLIVEAGRDSDESKTLAFLLFSAAAGIANHAAAIDQSRDGVTRLCHAVLKA